MDQVVHKVLHSQYFNPQLLLVRLNVLGQDWTWKYYWSSSTVICGCPEHFNFAQNEDCWFCPPSCTMKVHWEMIFYWPVRTGGMIAAGKPHFNFILLLVLRHTWKVVNVFSKAQAQCCVKWRNFLVSNNKIWQWANKKSDKCITLSGLKTGKTGLIYCTEWNLRNSW